MQPRETPRAGRGSGGASSEVAAGAPAPPHRRRGAWAAAALATLLTVAAPAVTLRGADEQAIEARLLETVRYLASDELEGRGIGTAGLDLAADYLGEQFSAIGLMTDLYDGTPFQRLRVSTDVELGPPDQNRLTLVAPASTADGEHQRVQLELGDDFNPLAIGGSGQFEAGLVFVGYGITAPEAEYDDYAEVDVEGNVVLMIRREPRQSDPDSPLNGTQPSQHAWFSRKVAGAYERGAAAVLIVNDLHGLRQQSAEGQQQWDATLDKLVELRREFDSQLATPDELAAHRLEVMRLVEHLESLGRRLESDFDAVLEFQGAGVSGQQRSLPVYFLRREAIDPIVEAALGATLAELEEQIDDDFTPRSRPLEGWTAEGQALVVQNEAEIRNVIGVLEGQGPLADETIIIGAHYDHLGYGGPGSLAPWTTEIHPGADDNASGTAALLEVARRFAGAPEPPQRRLVFIAFSGEERGLLGSAHYVREPLFPLETTVAMLNMDMVGRLTDDRLIVHGTGTASEFEGLVDELNQAAGFEIATRPSGFGPSDHASFYAHRIPVLHFFTGTHSDYHRPSDTYEKVNVPGLRRVAQLVGDVAGAIDEAARRPEYRQTQRPQAVARGGERPYLGTIPDFGQAVEGYALMGVAPGGPAERAGLEAGDVIVRFGDSRIGGLEDIDGALRRYRAGDEVPVEALRNGESVTVRVTLESSR